MEAVILDCLANARRQSAQGQLAQHPARRSGGPVIRRLLEKHPAIAPEEIDDVILGCAMPEAESGMNMARIAALRAGLPDSVPGRHHQSLLFIRDCKPSPWRRIASAPAARKSSSPAAPNRSA